MSLLDHTTFFIECVFSSQKIHKDNTSDYDGGDSLNDETREACAQAARKEIDTAPQDAISEPVLFVGILRP